jgi:hypothetical protein
VCSLIKAHFLYRYMYHTLIQNIQILGKIHFYNFSDFARYRVYNNYMAILDNVDNDKYPLFETESSSLAMKVFSETCCNGCSCKSESDHKSE